MIIGTIFGIIIAIIIVLALTSKSNKNEPGEKGKKEFAIPPQKKYPFMFYKDCNFYAESVSRFEYSDDEIAQFLKSLDDSFAKEDYAKAINLSNEMIKILPKSEKAWIKKIQAIFIDVLKNEKCWNEKLARSLLNACYGFLQCYDNVIEKSISVKYILLPTLLKNIEELIRYQNRSVTKYHNFEVYNMALNLYYVIPYKEILILISNCLLEDKVDKDFSAELYVEKTINSLLKQVDILRTRNTSKLQENFENKKITNCTLLNDERINANIIAFELTFEPGNTKEMIEAIFYDENDEEIHFGKNDKDRYLDRFEVDSDRGMTSKEEIVLLTPEPISKVKLKIYQADNENTNVETSEENDKVEDTENKEDLNDESDQSKDFLDNEETADKFVPAKNHNTPQSLMYPGFSDIKSIAISDTQFVALKENKTVISLGVGDKLKQKTTTWQDIDKVYVRNDAVFGVKADGKVIYAGNIEYESIEYINSWENVKSLSLGEKHLVALSKNSTMHAVGANSNGECDVEEWYDVIQMATSYHTVGLCKDGQVKATGENNFGECDVSAWQDIVQIAVGDFYTLGLTSSGRVLATGLNSCGQCNVGDWANIKKIFAKGNMSVGLRYDGKVVTAGKNSYHYGDIKNWGRIQDIVVSNNRIVGIEQDGTVRVAGKPFRNFVNGEWNSVVKVAINSDNIVGLKEDGTIVSNDMVFGYSLSDDADELLQICEDIDSNRIAMVSSKGVLTISNKVRGNLADEIYPTFYDVKKVDLSSSLIAMLKNDGTAEYMRFSEGVSEKIPNWNNLVDIAAGKDFIIGLDISGKVMGIGENGHGECEVSEWHDIVKIRAAEKRAVGLSIDGKLFMSGVSDFGEDDFIKIFKNVKDFALTNLQTMILENEKTVKVTYHPDGVDTEGVKIWKNIKKVIPRGKNFLCLSEEGKVYSTIKDEVEVTSWEEIEDIDASGDYVWAILRS